MQMVWLAEKRKLNSGHQCWNKSYVPKWGRKPGPSDPNAKLFSIRPLTVLTFRRASPLPNTHMNATVYIAWNFVKAILFYSENLHCTVLYCMISLLKGESFEIFVSFIVCFKHFMSGPV